MTRYADFHRRSIEDRDAFWAEQAQLIDWQTQPQTICDFSKPPFVKWFAGGMTNLCHNAVDRSASNPSRQRDASKAASGAAGKSTPAKNRRGCRDWRNTLSAAD